jgi:3',5'-cyclic AMP phosphodiesterase CpdA
MTPLKIIQITDCHMLAPGETIFGSDPGRRLRACIRDINRNHADASLCIFTGDLAHNGDPVAYQHFRRCLAELTVPHRLLMGNHDDRAGLLHAFPSVPLDENGFVQSVCDTQAGRFILMDTADAGVHTGAYCPARRRWLEARLQESGDRPVYLFLHHPPFGISLPHLDVYGMRQADADELGALLRRFKNVTHIFAGHVHRPVSGSWQGIPFHAVRGTNHQSWLDFGASDNVCSLEPPAYAIAFLGKATTVVHFHDFLDASPKYAYHPNAAAGAQIQLLSRALEETEAG